MILDSIDQRLADRVRTLRDERHWSLADLATASGVSKAMLSRIERAEASPTAIKLSQIASAFGITLAELLTFQDGASERFASCASQPEWRDPSSDYVRRQILAGLDVPLELVEVTMPPGQRASFPVTSYIGRRHAVWVLSGELTINEGGEDWLLRAGDRLLFGDPGPVVYANNGGSQCRYLVCVLRG